MGEHLSNISGPEIPRGINPVHSYTRKGSQKQKKGQAVNPYQDSVELSKAKGQDLPKKSDPVISKEDMARYVAMVKQLPDVRSDEVSRVNEKVQRGEYGQEALSVTANEIGKELGLSV